MELQVNNLILDYLQHIRLGMAKGTVNIKQWVLHHFYKFIDRTDKKPYYRITKEDVEKYLSSISNCKLGTRHYRTTAIRDFYRWLIKNDPVCARIENPASAIHFKKYKSRSLPHVPGESAVKECLADPSGNPEHEHQSESDFILLRDRLLLELAYGSGLRRSELAALNVEDLDTDSAQAHIRGKGGRERKVPLTQGSIDALRRYLAVKQGTRGPLLVSARGKRLKEGSVTWLLRTKYGIRPHLLRHACATHMLKNGCDIRYIQELLGHKDLTTTQVYTHIDTTDLKKVVGRLHPRSGFVN
jgi:integrase/recombinase XerC